MLFIDEIHRLARPVEEVLYAAMEDFALDIVIGKGPPRPSIRIDLPRFTLIGATTRTGRLTLPFRDGSGSASTGLLPFDDLTVSFVGRDPRRRVDEHGAGRSRDAPGAPPGSRTGSCVGSAISPRSGTTAGSRDVARALAALRGRRSRPRQDGRRALSAIVEKFGGGPVGLSTLAAALHEEADTLEDVSEPYLLQLGFLKRTPRGRVATERAYRHLGVTAEGALPLA